MSKFKIFLLAFMVSLSAWAQQKTVTGKVTDTQKNPMPGVSIQIKGSSKGVATDFDGNYSIEKVENGSVLIFSYVGFKTETRKVEGQASSLTLNVTMSEDAQQLEDVVVVGYGVQKKANVTGSVNTIKTEELQGKASATLAQALQGVTPGVTVIAQPKDVGEDMGSINIRGRGNLGSASPLYIVDGVPVSASDFQRVSPSDVESISVLKDAAATAIYGARAAYGVFLVTTKKGSEGKASVNYDGYYGFQSPTVLPNRLGSYEYAMLKNEMNKNDGQAPYLTEAEMEKIKAGNDYLYPNTDWYGLFYRKQAPITQHSISVSGGGKTRYFVSGTYFRQESLVPGRNLDRYSFRANTERKFSEKFKLGTNISFVRDNFSRKGDFNTSQTVDRISPLHNAYNPDGTWGSIDAGKKSSNPKINPIRLVEEAGWARYDQNSFIGSVNAELKPFDGLTITAMASYRSYDKRDNKFKSKVPAVIDYFSKKPMKGTDITPSELKTRWDKVENLMGQIYATYARSFGKNDLSLMVGTQYEAFKSDFLAAGRTNYPSNALETISSGSSKAENISNAGSFSERKFFSQFGRLNYAFDGKYLFEANIRLDQSSQFIKEQRLGVFPSFSAAWRLSQEEFIKRISWISNAKLRLSWGQAGYVNNIGFYDYFDVLSVGKAFVHKGSFVDGVSPSVEVNKNFTWETVTTKNIGLDAAFFKGALSFQLDVYDKRTTDILLRMPKPVEMGLTSKQRAATNAGVVSNKGVEFTLEHRGKIGKDLRYSVSGNISKIWNEIIDMKGLDDQIEGKYIKKVGESIGSLYGYKADGIYSQKSDITVKYKDRKNVGAGNIKFVDINGDGIISSQDRTIIGNDVPYFTYGMNFTLNYKNFDFSLQGQGVRDVSVALTEEASFAFFNGAGVKKFHLGRWTTENPNPNAAYPKLTAKDTDRAFSSFWLFDADYFRIKNIMLGYTLRPELSQMMGCQKVRFYLSGTNLFTIRADHRLEDFDPEMPTGRASYPNLKTISFGANISF